MTSRARIWLLVAALALAQLALAVHRTDVSAHGVGQQCEACLVGHGWQAGMAASPLVFVFAAPFSIPPHVGVAFSHRTTAVYASRAPPHFA